jgi:hypothetical protein
MNNLDESIQSSKPEQGSRSPETQPSRPVLATFASFQQSFREALNSDEFGAEEHETRPGELSTAKNELMAKRKVKLLGSDRFLESVHAIFVEYSRLVPEQSKVRDVGRQRRAEIKKLRDRQRSFKTCVKTIKALADEFKTNHRLDIGDGLLRALDESENRVKDRESDLIMDMHESDWSEIHRPRGFVPVLKPYNYRLASLRKKAPRQWLWIALSKKLKAYFRRAKPGCVSALTTYRIIGALESAAGIKSAHPEAIKQFLHSRKPSPTAPKNRN